MFQQLLLIRLSNGAQLLAEWFQPLIQFGVVTLDGNVKTSSDRSKAYDDAAKVNGVKRVINRITVG